MVYIINKTQSHTNFLTYYLWLNLRYKWQNLVVVTGRQSLKCLLSGPLQKKFVNSCSRPGLLRLDGTDVSLWASLMAQMVNNLPAMQETRV